MKKKKKDQQDQNSAPKKVPFHGKKALTEPTRHQMNCAFSKFLQELNNEKVAQFSLAKQESKASINFLFSLFLVDFVLVFLLFVIFFFFK